MAEADYAGSDSPAGIAGRLAVQVIRIGMDN
jgi:hypothetical protein